jgi:hypothetical protein
MRQPFGKSIEPSVCPPGCALGCGIALCADEDTHIAPNASVENAASPSASLRIVAGRTTPRRMKD